MNTKEKTIDALEELIDALKTELKYLKEWETPYTPEELLDYLNENAFPEFIESLKEATK